MTSEIKTGVERSRAAQAGFGQISDTVKEVTEIVSMVDRQTEGIAHSTSLIQTYPGAPVQQFPHWLHVNLRPSAYHGFSLHGLSITSNFMARSRL